jgi:hypothetical protein
MAKLNREQLEKLKKTWAIHKDFDLLTTKGVEEYQEELRDWMAEIELMEELRDMRRQFGNHTPEVCYRATKGQSGETLKRIKTDEGWLYMRTVWIGGVPSSSMCFVPVTPVLVAEDGTHPLPEGEVF